MGEDVTEENAGRRRAAAMMQGELCLDLWVWPCPEEADVAAPWHYVIAVALLLVHANLIQCL